MAELVGPAAGGRDAGLPGRDDLLRRRVRVRRPGRASARVADARAGRSWSAPARRPVVDAVAEAGRRRAPARRSGRVGAAARPRRGRRSRVLAVAAARSARWSPAALAADRVPWGNMYEFVLTVTFVGAAAWLVRAGPPPGAAAPRPVRRPALVVLLGFAGLVLYTPVGPLVPALNSYWLSIHVTAAVIGLGHPPDRLRAGRAVPDPDRLRQGQAQLPVHAGRAAARRPTPWSG